MCVGIKVIAVFMIAYIPGKVRTSNQPGSCISIIILIEVLIQGVCSGILQLQLHRVFKYPDAVDGDKPAVKEQ